MKILHLVVMGKYFDQFKAGTKDTEYRAYNDYWIARIMKDPRRGEELHTHVKLRRGYHRDAPTLLLPIIRVDVINERTELMDGRQFAIRLFNPMAETFKI